MINFPKKQPQKPEKSNSDKLKGRLINGLRILAFNEYKKRNYKSGLNGTQMYQNFRKEWFAQELHDWSLEKIQEFITELGYTEKELTNIVNEYYTKQNEFLKSGPIAYKPSNTLPEEQNYNLDF